MAETRPTEFIREGDIVRFLGTEHRITLVDPYDGPMSQYGCFAIAKASGGWKIALYEGQRLEIV